MAKVKKLRPEHFKMISLVEFRVPAYNGIAAFKWAMWNGWMYIPPEEYRGPIGESMTRVYRLKLIDELVKQGHSEEDAAAAALAAETEVFWNVRRF
jgi:hypothetical protein